MAKKRILLPPQFATVWGLNRAFSASSFSDVLRRNNAILVMVLPSTETERDMKQFVLDSLEGIDGILLQGGSDIHPKLYGEQMNGA